MQINNDIINYLKEGNLWIVYILLVSQFVIKKIIVKHKTNPRFKLLPYWLFGFLLLIILINFFNLISIQNTWILIGLLLVVFVYLYLINFTVNVSYEYLVVKLLMNKLNNYETVSYERFYERYRRYFFSSNGKFKFYMNYLRFISSFGITPLCFTIMDEIEKLKLTNKEKNKLYLLQFEIYNKIGALRLWEDKYELDKIELDKKDKLLIRSILSIQKFDLDLAESELKKLLAKSNNSVYKQIAENNLSVVAEYNGNITEWSDFIQKSHRNNEILKTDKHAITPNLIANLLHLGKFAEAQSKFDEYIESLPNKILEQRIIIYNEKLLFYSQTNNLIEIRKVLESIFEEYQKAPELKKYYLLISLFRMTYNHQILFEEVLNEVDVNLEHILNQEFQIILRISQETIGVAKNLINKPNMQKVNNIAYYCIKKLKEFDFDKELSKLRYEEVNLKRDYIKFKIEMLNFDFEPSNAEDFEKLLYQKFVVLDELISFDRKNLFAFHQLDSLFIKLDEITNAISVFINIFSFATTSQMIYKLHDEAYIIIPQISEIMDKATNSKNMAEYHLKLAHYYCCLNKREDGYVHFKKFKESKVRIENYANWLREFYFRLEKYFQVVVN